MKRLSLLLAAAALWPATVNAQSTLLEDATAFGFRTSVDSIELSPDGRKVAYIEPAAGGAAVAYVADLDRGTVRGFLRADGGAEYLAGCTFVTNVRLACRYLTTVDDSGVLVDFSRLIAINSDGSGLKRLGQSTSAYDERIRQFDGNIIDWLPSQAGAVLMAREYIPEAGKTGSLIARSADGLGVDRVDTLTLASKSVERPRKGASGYMSDGQGNVRLMVIREADGQGILTGRVRIDYRPLNSREWKVLSGFAKEQIEPLKIDGTTNSLYALKKLDGRNALYRIRLTDPVQTEVVASNPRVDIDQVISIANGQRVIGYSFVEDKRDAVYFDPEYKALRVLVAKALPNLPLIEFLDSSADGSKILLFAGSDSDPGRYYLFDRTTKNLNELLLARPQLDKRTLASVKPVSVRVADGTNIPAYLTLPPGKEAKNLPSIVLPHGGPSSRDEWGFDWLAQFLAARGYAVIQPNYRGSAGFGDKWLMDNGFKSWRTSIGDITGSIKWLISQGIADPNRLAAVGWSYGGYAALQAAATEPGLFKAVAAIAPVTDLQLLKTENRGYTSARVVSDFVGSGPHIQEGSPLQRAASIKVPVLLVHGDKDSNVGVEHSLKMQAALRSRGTPVELLRYKALDHRLYDSAARREILLKLGELLDRTIGR